jgi:precorrin-6B C5,15-methyltransferase / cobalt-precorrin-6B C5,C15-methyltransferase
VVENPDVTVRPFGIDDSEFVRGSAPMTKSEVRTLSVSKLALEEDSVVYDIGAGTGSVSVQMALVSVEGRVYAIEKEPDAVNLIEVNKVKFKTPNVIPVTGTAPKALIGLPAPTHAFIGGSSGNMKEILKMLIEANPDVRIVMNAVTLETIAEIVNCIRVLGLIEEEITCVSVSKAREVGLYHMMNAQNPVYIAVCRGPGR